MVNLRTKLGPLDCRVLQASDAPPKLAVLLCHGYGAPGDDLVPLAPELTARDGRLNEVRFVFPEAPLQLDDFGGRAWWPLSMARWAALQTGDPSALQAMQEETPDGLPQARKMLLAALDVVARQTQLPLSRVVLGGFSQGAMLATDVTLRLEEAPAGLAILSGTLLSRTEWSQRAPKRAGLPTLQTHGRGDPILPYSGAEALNALLTQAGLEVEFVSFDGGHTIGPEGFSRLLAFLTARLTS